MSESSLKTLSRMTIWLFAGVVLMLLVTAGLRGPDLDEFATFVFADRSHPLIYAWRNLWLSETNPPLFYWMAREWQGLTGPSLLARRLLNGLPLAALCAWGLWAYRQYPKRRLFICIYSLVVITTNVFSSEFSDYRSYFFQFVAATIFIGSALLDGLDRRVAPNYFELASIPFLFELHQITALYAGVLLVLFMGADLVEQNWPRLLARAAAGLVSGAPLLAFTWLQHHQTHAVLSEVAWISHRSVPSSIAAMADFMLRDLGANVFGLVAVVWVLSIKSLRPEPRTSAALLILLAGLLAGSGALLVVNTMTPLIVSRYFAFPAAELCGVLALLACPLVERHPRLSWLFIAQAFLYIAIGGVQMSLDRRWNDGADKVAALAAQCPGGDIHAGSNPPMPAERLGLNYLAQAHGFKVLPPGIGQPGRCPAIYWTETSPANRKSIALAGGDVARAANDTANWGLSKAALAHAIVVRSANGAILVVRR